MKRMLSLFGALAIMAILGLLIGCAGLPPKGGIGDIDKDPASRGDYNRLSTRLADIEKSQKGLANDVKEIKDTLTKAKPAEVTAAAKLKEAAPPKAEEPKLEASAPAPAEKVAAPAQNEAIADLQKRVGVLEIKTINMGNELDAELDAVKNEIAGIKIRLVKVNKTVGATLELTGMSGQRYFLIGPFSVGSAEIKGAVAQQLKKLTTLMKKEKLMTAKIIGFTDTTPFKSAKDPAENKTKNLELAKNRANALAKALGKLSDGAEILGRGATEQFNGRPANRCVMVVVAKKAPAPAPAAPTPPPTPAPPAPQPPAPPASQPAPAQK